MESWYARKIDFLNLFPRHIMVPLKIPTLTHAPDQDGPVACLSGPVAIGATFQEDVSGVRLVSSNQ